MIIASSNFSLFVCFMEYQPPQSLNAELSLKREETERSFMLEFISQETVCRKNLVLSKVYL